MGPSPESWEDFAGPGLGSATFEGGIGAHSGYTWARTGGGKGCLMLSNCKGSSLDSVTTGEQDSTVGCNQFPSSKDRTESIVDVTDPWSPSVMPRRSYFPAWFRLSPRTTKIVSGPAVTFQSNKAEQNTSERYLILRFQHIPMIRLCYSGKQNNDSKIEKTKIVLTDKALFVMEGENLDHKIQNLKDWEHENYAICTAWIYKTENGQSLQFQIKVNEPNLKSLACVRSLLLGYWTYTTPNISTVRII